MQMLDTSSQELLFSVGATSNVTPIVFLNGDGDDLLANQTQRLDAASATSQTQEQFRMIAQNLQEAGIVLSLFC